MNQRTTPQIIKNCGKFQYKENGTNKDQMILFFTETSSDPYDRISMNLFIQIKYLIFDSWEEVRNEWFNMAPQFKSHVNVYGSKIEKSKKN